MEPPRSPGAAEPTTGPGCSTPQSATGVRNARQTRGPGPARPRPAVRHGKIILDGANVLKSCNFMGMQRPSERGGAGAARRRGPGQARRGSCQARRDRVAPDLQNCRYREIGRKLSPPFPTIRPQPVKHRRVPSTPAEAGAGPYLSAALAGAAGEAHPPAVPPGRLHNPRPFRRGSGAAALTAAGRRRVPSRARRRRGRRAGGRRGRRRRSRRSGPRRGGAS